jgi:chromosome partitioning protein
VVVAVINTKGGVGKTTTAIHLAAVLAEGRGRTLLVDADSQAGASLGLGIARADLAPSLAQPLLYSLPLDRALRASRVDGLDLITGSVELANTDLALREVGRRELWLRELLDPLRRRYRAIVIDCPPGLSLLHINALAAADWYLVPVSPQYLPMEGVAALLRIAARVRARYNPRLRLLGIHLSMVDRRSRVCAGMCKRLRRQYGDAVLRTEIPLSGALADAPSLGQTIFQYQPQSRAAVAYRTLAGEILTRLRRRRQRGN